VPVCKAGTYVETGETFSDHHFIGAIFTSVEYQFPYPDLSLNVSFAHELGHQALTIYQHSGDMLFGSDAWVYSGVRKTERPIVSALHAAVALAYMIEAIRSLLRSERDIGKTGYLHALLDEYTSGLRQGLSALAPFPKSELCENIVKDLEIVLD
jgi:HEXXH motif-containing protein